MKAVLDRVRLISVPHLQRQVFAAALRSSVGFGGDFGACLNIGINDRVPTSSLEVYVRPRGLVILGFLHRVSRDYDSIPTTGAFQFARGNFGG